MSLFRKKEEKPAQARNKYSVSVIQNKTKVLRKRIEAFKSKDKVLEEPVKIQLVLPFFSAFGWDASDHLTDEFEVTLGNQNRADILMKKGKAVKIVVETKAFGVDMTEKKHINQLAGYFDNCHASIGILTDGEMYHFFSYKKGSGVCMDKVPFAVVDISRLQLGGRNSFLMYLCRQDLDIDKLVKLSRVRFTYKRIGAKGTLKTADSAVRAEFQKDFPDAAPQELDELIAFANNHYKDWA